MRDKKAVSRTVMIGAVAIIAIIAVAGAATYYLTLPTEAPLELRIGVPAPLTGYAGLDGVNFRDAAMMIANEVNEAGGLRVGDKTYMIKVVPANTEGKADVAVAAVQRLLTVDKVHVIVGSEMSSCTMAWMDMAQEAKIPTIITGATMLTITEKIMDQNYKYIFRLSPTNVDLMRESVRAISELWEGKAPKIAIYMIEKEAQFEMTDFTETMLKEYVPEAEVIYKGFVPSETVDYTPDLLKIRTLDPPPDILYIVMPIGPFPAQAYEVGIPQMMTVFSAAGTPGGTESELEEYTDELEGWVVNARYMESEVFPEMVAFNKEFLQTYGYSPLYHAHQVYDGMDIMFEAIERAGSLDPDRIVEELEKTDKVGLRGFRMRFTPMTGEPPYYCAHEMPTTLVIVQIQNGKRVIVYPKDKATGEFVPVGPG